MEIRNTNLHKNYFEGDAPCVLQGAKLLPSPRAAGQHSYALPVCLAFFARRGRQVLSLQ